MPHPRPEHTREALVAAARAVAARLGGGGLTIGRFCAETGINPSRVYARFDDWPSLCAEAGLRPGEKPPEVETARLLADLHAAVMEAGGMERQVRLMRRVPASAATYVRRFGGWGATLRALRDWVAANAPDFPYRLELDARIAAHSRRRKRGGAGAGTGNGGMDGKAGGRGSGAAALRPPWPSTGGRACGPALAFRAMACAPVNEMGVVLLFGMVADELGYAVDAIGTAFPDCVAKRLVAQGAHAADARWEPVRIEFEFRSRSFLYHAHDPDLCDVIVCWEHDWPDCPLEVLELRAVVAAASGQGQGQGRGQGFF